MSCDGPLSRGGVMRVRWVNGREVLWLWNYNTTSLAFDEVRAGIATGRAAIVNATTFALQILGETVLSVDGGSGGLVVDVLRARGGTVDARSPRVEFWKGNVRLATVVKDGSNGVLTVGRVLDATAVQGADKFCFRGGGVVRATLGATSLLTGKVLVG